ncbi:MAG: phosphoglycerate dehydrogenase [Bacteroidia bacterium]
MTATSYPRNKLKILLLEGINPASVEMFRLAGYTEVNVLKYAPPEAELKKLIKDVHVLGIRSKTQLTENIFEGADKLMAIAAFCIGTNQIDLKKATEKGIAVFNSPFSNTRSVAELVIALSIILMRRIYEKSVAAHAGGWLKDHSGAHEVRGKTLGIIGYGHIGSQVSVLAESLGMNVIFYDIETKLSLGNARPVNDLNQLLKQSDIITLHVPGTPLTKNIIDKKRMKFVKKGAVLLNLSRGDVMDVNEAADAIKSGVLGGLAVDVFPDEPSAKGDKFISELQGLPNVILTPHIGGSTEEAQVNIAADATNKLINFVETGSSNGSLSIPPLSLPVQQDAHRLLHIHKNVPGVLSEITSILSNLNVNILGQYLKTNEQVGYVVLDIDKKTSSKALEAMKKVKHTIKVRSLY